VIVTIHQPEHFPYEGFFQKMDSADLFVILDCVKFRKNYFQNRNKFLNQQGVEEWFGVSVPKNSTSHMIKDVATVDDSLNHWRKKVLKKISHNLKMDATSVYEPEKLIDINIRSIEWCRERMNITTPMVYASSLSVAGSKTDLLLDICKRVEATTYLSGPSGKDYLELEKFETVGIKIDFFSPEVKNYYSMLYNLNRQGRK
jgi:hypothetical protein